MNLMDKGMRKLRGLRRALKPPLFNRIPAAWLRRRKHAFEQSRPELLDTHGWFSEHVDAVPEQVAAEHLSTALLDSKPLMVTRFGYVELECLLNYLAVTRRTSWSRAYRDFLHNRTRPFWWDHRWIRSMANNAGFFPDTVPMIRRYGDMIMDLLPDIDTLAVWLKGESLLAPELAHVERVPLATLEPFHFEHPWTDALAGQRVVVVHPFETSIRNQYERRRDLFADQRVLPDFELITVKAPQSIAGNKTGHATWFDALDDLTTQVALQEFDVALIGCGAYGMPLAARVKRMGRKAVHVGGSLQLLFGIRGRRWDDRAHIAQHFNEHWVYPHESERPASLHRVEGGCYW